jgi:hypothetical protein
MVKVLTFKIIDDKPRTKLHVSFLWEWRNEAQRRREDLDTGLTEEPYVFRRVNKHKTCGPDGISNWLLKEYAEILAEPVTHILNASFKE